MGIFAITQISLGADLNIGDAKLLRPIDTLSDVKLVPVGLTQEKEVHYLVGNFDQIKGTINTDAGLQHTSFRGEIAFQAVSNEKSEISLALVKISCESTA